MRASRGKNWGTFVGLVEVGAIVLAITASSASCLTAHGGRRAAPAPARAMLQRRPRSRRASSGTTALLCARPAAWPRRPPRCTQRQGGAQLASSWTSTSLRNVKAYGLLAGSSAAYLHADAVVDADVLQRPGPSARAAGSGGPRRRGRRPRRAGRSCRSEPHQRVVLRAWGGAWRRRGRCASLLSEKYGPQPLDRGRLGRRRRVGVELLLGEGVGLVVDRDDGADPAARACASDPRDRRR